LKNSGPGIQQKALGLIETQGRASLIEMVDNAVKAAGVDILASYFVGGGCNAVTLVGDLGSLRAALDAAQGLMAKQGIDGRTHLIPRLAEQVWPLVIPQQTLQKAKKGTEKRHGTV
jgi:energy-coupling factor transport system substrate-specific component